MIKFNNKMYAEILTNDKVFLNFHQITQPLGFNFSNNPKKITLITGWFSGKKLLELFFNRSESQIDSR